MSIQCFFGPSSLPYLVSSSKYCYLLISVVIHSHNMTKVSQAKLPYPVVYFLPQIEMFPNAIIVQPVSLYNDENPPEKCHLKYIQSMFWGSVHFPSFRVVKKADQDNVLYICNFIIIFFVKKMYFLSLYFLLTKHFLVHGMQSLLTLSASWLLK